MKGLLYLEDGLVFSGQIFGNPKMSIGEVCLNTSMSGYQEIITDPSYACQIVVMSYPLIGNYGTNPIDIESRQPFLTGFVIREYCRHPQNQKMRLAIDDYLRLHQITAIEDIDTRALVRHIREKGEMRAAIVPLPVNEKSLLNKIRQHPRLEGQNLASTVSTKSTYKLGHHRKVKIVVYDFGVKTNILRLLGKNATI